MCAFPSQFGGISAKWQKETLKNKISFANDSITIQVCRCEVWVSIWMESWGSQREK